MVDEAQRTAGAPGPRVVVDRPPRPGRSVLDPLRAVTGVLVALAAVVTLVVTVVGAGEEEGVGALLVRVAFVGLWASVPWLATTALAHLAVRARAATGVVGLVAGVAWVGTWLVVGALTPVLWGGDAGLAWGLAGGAVGTALLVVATRFATRSVPPPAAPPHVRGPFLD